MVATLTQTIADNLFVFIFFWFILIDGESGVFNADTKGGDYNHNFVKGIPLLKSE